MTRTQIEAAIHQLDPWFHCVDLGDGLRTKTVSIAGEPVDHPHPTWQTIQRCLPADLSGQSVLDVGCNAGFYAVEAKRRGAARVLGVDVQRLHIRQATLVKKVLGLDLEFRRASVYDLSPRLFGQFDVTLALGLIYHCKHLLLALENLAQVTRHTLVLETAVYPPHLQPAPFTYVHGGQRRTIHSLGYVENAADAQESAFNWFLPSVSSLGALLRQAGFEDVEVVSVADERAVCVCRKPKVYPDSRTLGKLGAALTLVDGPSRCQAGESMTFRVCAGNTGFVTWLSEGEAENDYGVVRLGAHLLTADGDEVSWDYGRASLDVAIQPGGSAELTITMRAPEQAGDYVVEFDMVAEHLAWFENLGSSILACPITVEA